MTDWIDDVERLSKERWLEQKKPLLLSQIPHLSTIKARDLSAILQGRRLKAALEAEGKDRLRFVQNPKAPLQWGVLPINVSDDEFRESLGDADAADSSIPLFPRQFWSAFIKPLKPGASRYVMPTEAFHFRDIMVAERRPEGGIEVKPSFIAKLAPDQRAERTAIYKAITSWGKENNVDLKQITQAPKSHEQHLRTADSYLRFLSGLNTEDASRIMVPLDIVVKLMRRG